MPSVPRLAALRPRPSRSGARKATVEVLPLVPVTAAMVAAGRRSARRGAPARGAASSSRTTTSRDDRRKRCPPARGSTKAPAFAAAATKLGRRLCCRAARRTESPASPGANRASGPHIGSPRRRIAGGVGAAGINSFSFKRRLRNDGLRRLHSMALRGSGAERSRGRALACLICCAFFAGGDRSRRPCRPAGSAFRSRRHEAIERRNALHDRADHRRSHPAGGGVAGWWRWASVRRPWPGSRSAGRSSGRRRRRGGEARVGR